MVDFSQPVSFEFISLTVGLLLALVAVGVFFVKKAKISKD